MIEINLITTQVPDHIDLPNIKKSKKPLIILIFTTFIVVILIFVCVYFFFVRNVEKIILPNKNEAREYIEKKSEKHIEEKQNINHKEESITQHEAKIKKKEKAEQAVEAAKKNKDVVFSFDIQLENVPNKDNSSTNEIVLDDLKQQQKKTIKTDNKTVQQNKKTDKAKLVNILRSNSSKKVNKKIAKNRYITVKIQTKTSPFYLMKNLKKLHIKYKYRKLKIKEQKSYDIYVGGFDSYKKLVRFAAVLKQKGYKIYGIENFGLLFYVNIDKNVNLSKRNRYIDVWKHTPFRIIAKERQTAVYKYIFVFRTTKEKIGFLKKYGFKPVILKTK